MANHEVFRFGDFELDPAAWQLTRNGGPVPIEPKGLALLALLVGRPGQVITKHEILDAVWKDTAVTENAMVRVVAHLRGALDDDPKVPKYIETVHTRGYRFVAPVTRAAVQPPGRPARPRSLVPAAALVLAMIAGAGLYMAGDRPTGARPADAPSIAVLPLENLGPQAQQYFADGMTDALTTQLARIEALKVIARGAVVRYAGERPPPSVIARELGVSRLVEGSVLLAGEQVRITARLVDGDSNRTLWADSYDGELHDVLALQSRVARAIVGEIRGQMTSDEERRLQPPSPVDPAAYRAYLRGLFHFERSLQMDDRMFESLHESQKHLEEAVAIQRDWGAAHGALAQTHLRLAGMLDDHQARLRHNRAGRQAAEQALELDPTAVTAQLAMARTWFFIEGDWERAERGYREVLRLEPNNADWSFGLFLTWAGRFDEAIARLRSALERWPTSPTVRFWLAWSCVCAGRYEDALAEAEELRTRLADEPHAALIEAMVLGRTGRHAEGLERLEAHREALMTNRATTFLQTLSYLAAKAGDVRRVKAAVADLERLGGRAPVATLLAMGDVEGALTRLRQLHAARDYSLRQLRCSPEYENLLQIPEAHRIVREHGPGSSR